MNAHAFPDLKREGKTGPASAPFRLTKVTAIKPTRLTKRFSLLPDGSLKREAGGHLVRGTCEVLTVPEVSALREVVEGLKPCEALVYGIPKTGTGGPVASRDAAQEGDITRTRDAFDWPAGPGVLLLDYDPPKDGDPLDEWQLWETLTEVAPGLADAPALCLQSASGNIFNGETGDMLRGPGGIHVEVIVADARDIPRAGKAIADRLWLAGHGRYDLSSSGSLLERTLIDCAVWQPERLDFAAGAECLPPLEQRRQGFMVFNPHAAPLDTAALLPDVTDPRLIEAKKEARAAVAGRQQEVRAVWVEERVSEALKRAPAELTDDQKEAVRERYRRAVEGDLFGEFELTAPDGQAVTVGEMLDNPDRWHNKRFADPLEPEYGNDPRIAWANLKSGGRPYLYSHAHGGQRFNLIRAPRTIKVSAGELPRVVIEAEGLVARAGEVYQRGGELVRVADDRILPVQGPWLRTHLETAARFERFDKKANEWTVTDCPGELHGRILANRGGWPFPELRGLLKAPTLRPDGSVLDKPGYDLATGLLLMADGPGRWPAISLNPTPQEVRAALARLWEPVATFPYVEALDRAVMLAAMLTAAVRPVLPTAPGFLVTAHTAGTGKTKLAMCLGALTGTQPAVAPWAREGEEQRKALMASLLAGPSALVIDNIVGGLDSAELCAILTGETYEDRRLGASERVTVPTAVLMLATGNNVSVVGDLGRRILPVRLDHGVERPDRLEFAFDPVARVRERWLSLRCDALTVLRGYLAAGAPKLGTGSLGSFEQWDSWVRQCVVWIGENGLANFDLADPAEVVARNFDEDPETTKLRAALESWDTCFASSPKTVADAIAEAQRAEDTLSDTPARRALFDALDEIAGERGKINSRRLGRWVERNSGRIVDGRRFERAGVYCGKTRWVVSK